VLERRVPTSIVLLLVLLTATTVSAEASGDDVTGEAQGQAGELQRQLPGKELIPRREQIPPTPGLPDAGLGDANRALGESEQAAQQAAAETEATLRALLADVERMIPADPVGFINDQLNPVRQAAAQVEALMPQGTATAEPMEQQGFAQITALDMPRQQALLAVGATAAAVLALLWLAGSSGSLGAGAATTASGKVASTDLRRLLPFASPLFTRFEKDTVLGHPKREALYALILQTPGISLQSLCDATGLSRTAVTHHLRLLEMQHLIVSKRMGRSRHYYENGGRFGRDQKEALAVLQNERSKEVAAYVKDHPGAIQKTLCQALGLQPSIAHWHLSRLQQAQLVESVRSGRTVAYYPSAAMRGMQAPPVPIEALALSPTMA
jgi:DNA-binding transcriptional ArsR family regulator